MGILSWLTGSAGKAVADSAEGIGKGVSSIATGIREVIKGPEADPTRMAELAAEADRLQVEAARLQTTVNEAEARSPSLFVAGWRPALGWCGAAAVAYKYIIRPFLSIWLDAPDIDTAALWPMILGMLGLGGYRTYEKKVGVQDRH